jgi:hypothetical protein
MMGKVVDLYAENGSVCDLGRDDAEKWIDDLQSEMSAQAACNGLSVRDFACTLLVTVIESQYAAFLQIGDGAIVVSTPLEPDEYHWVFWPERGEYANQTCFVTDEDAAHHLQFDSCNMEIDEVALFSDGVQSLALHYESRTAYAPFFHSFFVPVRAEPPGKSDTLCTALDAFLNSPRVIARTDDDKTLVISTRRHCDAGADDRSGKL